MSDSLLYNTHNKQAILVATNGPFPEHRVLMNQSEGQPRMKSVKWLTSPVDETGDELQFLLTCLRPHVTVWF